MPYVASNNMALNDAVDLRVFSCLCVTRADIVPSCDRYVYILKTFFSSLVSLTFGFVRVYYFLAYGYNFGSQGKY